MSHRIDLDPGCAGGPGSNLGVEDALRLLERPGQQRPAGLDDGGPPGAHPVLVPAVEAVAPWEVRRDIGPAEHRGDADDKGASLPSVVAKRADPVLAVVPGRRQEDVD